MTEERGPTEERIRKALKYQPKSQHPTPANADRQGAGMTDQTKQRTSEMLEYVTGIKAEYLGDPNGVLLGGKHYQHILAWSDRQSAAAQAAALRMAAEQFHGQEMDQFTGDTIARMILALITPAGTSGLASMLEEAEIRGHNRAAIEFAVSNVSGDLSDRDARVREKAKNAGIEMVVDLLGHYSHDAIISLLIPRVRALKSGSPPK